MKLTKLKYYPSDIVVSILFVISPFWTMPIVLFQLFKTRRSFYAILISVFFGLTASLLAPTGDLYRLYMDYFYFQNGDFNTYMNYIRDKPDFLFYFILYAFAKLGLSLRLLIFILIFSFYQLSFNLLLKKEKYFGVFVIILFILQFDFLLHGLFLRFPLSMLIVIYATLNKLEGKKYVLLLLILASVIHFSALITIPLFYLSKMNFKKLNLYFLLSLIIMPFGSFILIYLVSNLLELYPDMPLSEKLNSYFLGYWSLEYFEDRTWKALLLFYFERAFYIIILLYFIFTRNLNKYRKQALVFFILINVLFSFPNLFSRFSILGIFFGLFAIIQENKKTNIAYFIKLSLALIIPIVFTMRIVAQQKSIRAGYMPSILYKNIILIYNKEYDIYWIRKNIDEDTARPKSIKSL